MDAPTRALVKLPQGPSCELNRELTRALFSSHGETTGDGGLDSDQKERIPIYGTPSEFFFFQNSGGVRIGGSGARLGRHLDWGSRARLRGLKIGRNSIIKVIIAK